MTWHCVLVLNSIVKYSICLDINDWFILRNQYFLGQDWQSLLPGSQIHFIVLLLAIAASYFLNATISNIAMIPFHDNISRLWVNAYSLMADSNVHTVQVKI